MQPLRTTIAGVDSSTVANAPTAAITADAVGAATLGAAMIPKEREAEILRLYHAEHWRIGTIARELGLHHTTVQRVLQQAGTQARVVAQRPSIAEPYIPLIVEMLTKYPRLTASRLYEMARQRGYTGSPDHFRRVVGRNRPRKPAEAFQRLSTLPGEQAQVDWAHFGEAVVGRARRKLYAFVMVLSWSRHAVVRFFLGASMPYFLRGHVDAFEAFGGVPRVCLYDNLKSAVLERRGDAIRFNPTLLSLAGHYRFEPRPVAVARGNEKGRVERMIRYLRGSFFEARKWTDVDDLNRQAEQWTVEVAATRPWPQDKRRTVADAFEEEREQLLPLGSDAFVTDQRIEADVGKTPYVRFDLNDYSVPHNYVRRNVTVLASLQTVRVLVGAEVIAEHRRSWDRGKPVEDPRHVQALADTKRRAAQERGTDRLVQACASARAFLQHAAKRGLNLGRLTQLLIELLNAHGAEDLEEALVEALERDRIHLGAVRHVLDRNRAARGLPPPVLHQVGPERLNHLVVKPHDLGSYDRVNQEQQDDKRD
jgi:transposase